MKGILHAVHGLLLTRALIFRQDYRINKIFLAFAFSRLNLEAVQKKSSQSG